MKVVDDVFRDLAELRAKFLTQHAPRRVLSAERRIHLSLVQALYRAAGAHRLRAEGELHAAIAELDRWRETEAEWFAASHGLMNAIAVELDKDITPREPTAEHSAAVRNVADLPDRRPSESPRHMHARPGDRPGAGLRRRRLERRAAVRLMWRLRRNPSLVIPQGSQ